MQVRLHPTLAHVPAAQAAAGIISQCVHCGFCLPACATYRQLGNELDGPRGRIYLLKQLVEGQAAGDVTRDHLDLCLGCGACESACPSGVRYGALLAAGTSLLDARSPRSVVERLRRSLLRRWLTGPWFAPSVRFARLLGRVLPAPLARRVGAGIAEPRSAAGGPTPVHRLRTNDAATSFAALAPGAAASRRVLLLRGCVQPSLRPGIDPAAIRLLGALGITTVVAPDAGCCGAIDQHLDDPARALARARRNIDAWWPLLQSGVEAVLVTASGCAAQVVDYGRLLRDDPLYATRAVQIGQLCRDLSQLLVDHAATLETRLAPVRADERVVVHAPCTLQNSLRLGGAVESLLVRLGARLVPAADGNVCCGSAGSYSLLHPELSAALRERKLAALLGGAPDRILSSNIGCIAHLAADSHVPVQHWAEWLAGRLTTGDR